MSALTDITSAEVDRKRKFGTFIDLYAGCGGLSLGLMMAGWIGLFAIERDRHAFETLHHNLIEGLSKYKFQWPSWLPKKRFRIGPFLKKYRKQLEELKGQVDLLVGGPPCQGFSMAGKRRRNDPRNKMFRHYIQMVQLICPNFVLLENVQGIDVEFHSGIRTRNNRKRKETFAVRIQTALEGLNYRVFVGVVNATEYGVPQMRKRYFLFAVANEQLTESCQQILDGEALNPFELLRSVRRTFLAQKDLPVKRPVTVRDAISDLRTINRRLIECEDSPGFKQIAYTTPKTPYQILLHGGEKGISPNSMRLVNHRKETVRRFKKILATCRRGVLLSRSDRKRLGMKKHATVPLDGDKPSHTLTTLPDDLLHYLEPRILTVRESARLQSFPDWFEFKGKYTTGGRQRVRECPRYTQVGNAVPPLLAEVIGLVLAELNNAIAETKIGQDSRRQETPQSPLKLKAA